MRSLLFAGAGALSARGLPALAASAQILSRAIPGSGEKLPAVGLGTWQAFDVKSDAGARRDATETLRTFIAEGLRVIDTSPMYGSAEATVGELLNPIDGGRSAFIATKVWTNGADAGRRQIENSFRLLQRDRLDLIQVHNLVDADTQLPTLASLKRDGRLRYVGVSHSNASAHATLVKYIERGTLDFVQVNYSLMEREAQRTVLPAAIAHGVAVLINRPLADGALLARVRGRELAPLAKEIGATTWAQFALKWILGHPAVTCVIPGTRNPAHLLDNIGAARGAMPDDSTRARMAALFDA
jgi:aryl-alcohol dehydrogenase-like predicted oxidoreductase